MNLTHFEEAIVNFEQQLASLEKGGAKPGSKEQARAYGNLGRLLRRPRRSSGGRQVPRTVSPALLTGVMTALFKLSQLLSQGEGPREQERAYRGLGLTQRRLGNLQEALVCSS